MCIAKILYQEILRYAIIIGIDRKGGRTADKRLYKLTLSAPYSTRIVS